MTTNGNVVNPGTGKTPKVIMLNPAFRHFNVNQRLMYVPQDTPKANESANFSAETITHESII